MDTVQEETKALFRKAVERASLAPSVHNTQPWHFVVRPDALELHAENDRRLRALDPTGRQMVISCGCALFNARVGLAADSVVQVDRLPDPAKQDLLARLTVLDEPAPWTPLVRLDPMIERRHTNRRDFFDEDVPPDVISELTTAARAGRDIAGTNCGARAQDGRRAAESRGRDYPEHRPAVSSRAPGLDDY